MIPDKGSAAALSPPDAEDPAVDAALLDWNRPVPWMTSRDSDQSSSRFWIRVVLPTPGIPSTVTTVFSVKDRSKYSSSCNTSSDRPCNDRCSKGSTIDPVPLPPPLLPNVVPLLPGKVNELDDAKRPPPGLTRLLLLLLLEAVVDRLLSRTPAEAVAVAKDMICCSC